MKKDIRILIADDHAIVRIGLAALFKTERGFCVIGQAANGTEAIRLAGDLNPDVVIMDLMMPDLSGVEATQAILRARPETRVVVLTTFGTSDGIARALEAGACGAFLKTANDADLIAGVRAVAAGGAAVSAEVRQLLAEDPAVPELTSRQCEILDYVTRGFTNPDIAHTLGIRESSVKEHLMDIFGKIGAANRAEAVAIALRKQLLKIWPRPRRFRPADR